MTTPHVPNVSPPPTPFTEQEEKEEDAAVKLELQNLEQERNTIKLLNRFKVVPHNIRNSLIKDVKDTNPNLVDLDEFDIVHHIEDPFVSGETVSFYKILTATDTNDGKIVKEYEDPLLLFVGSQKRLTVQPRAQIIEAYNDRSSIILSCDKKQQGAVPIDAISPKVNPDIYVLIPIGDKGRFLFKQKDIKEVIATKHMLWSIQPSKQAPIKYMSSLNNVYDKYSHKVFRRINKEDGYSHNIIKTRLDIVSGAHCQQDTPHNLHTFIPVKLPFELPTINKRKRKMSPNIDYSPNDGARSVPSPMSPRRGTPSPMSPNTPIGTPFDYSADGTRSPYILSPNAPSPISSRNSKNSLKTWARRYIASSEATTPISVNNNTKKRKNRARTRPRCKKGTRRNNKGDCVEYNSTKKRRME